MECRPDTISGKRKRVIDVDCDERGDVESEEDGRPEARIAFDNPACVTTTFHTESMEERVVATVVLPSGCTAVEVDLNGAGTKMMVSMRWPTEMVEVDAMFNDELKAKTMMPCHPLLMSLKKALV
jgi:hypothetical protein